jgi:membrane protein YdbS with pleckstrin-like domain
VPSPREADDRQVTLAITTAWVLALVIVFLVRDKLPADVRWWVWTCVTGVLMGLFALWYVPLLKRRRVRIAAERARLAGTQVSSGYVSRDNGSNTVSSTETPGKSTRS